MSAITEAQQALYNLTNRQIEVLVVMLAREVINKRGTLSYIHAPLRVLDNLTKRGLVEPYDCEPNHAKRGGGVDVWFQLTDRGRELAKAFPATKAVRR